MADKVFVNGMVFKEPHQNAPDFVKGTLSIKAAEFVQWMRENIEKGEEWLNIDLKVSKNGKAYAELSTWKPNQTQPKYPQGRQEPPRQSGGRNTGYGQEINDQQWEQSNKQKSFEDDIPF